MKKLPKLLALVLCLTLCVFTAVSCAGSQKIKNGYAKVVEYIEESLYDPESLKISSAEGVFCSDGEDIYYKISYNAKNRLGGYVGIKDYYYTYDTITGSVSTLSVTTTFGLQKSMYEIQKKGEKFEETYYYLKIK